ncbi:MAG: dephospho-CoA kinase [Longimicrobiales bacterium]|nr:dephospho-CoA kinase [Longimicrobiales bacterium]
MLHVGLTGSVASGKSTVAGMWREAGVPVVSADDLARRVVEPGTVGLRRVVEEFGEEVLEEDGSLDRAALRNRIFRNEEDRRRLEEILHPLIAEHRSRWMEEVEGKGASLAVAEIPLLFEAGLEEDFDVVVVVDAPREERLRRLVEDRGLAEDEALRMMDAQMDADEKRSRADFVLDNGAGIPELRTAAGALLAQLRSHARKEGFRTRSGDS